MKKPMKSKIHMHPQQRWLQISEVLSVTVDFLLATPVTDDHAP